jgi:hypothetical protein
MNVLIKSNSVTTMNALKDQNNNDHVVVVIVMSNRSSGRPFVNSSCYNRSAAVWLLIPVHISVVDFHVSFYAFTVISACHTILCAFIAAW